MTKKEAKRQKKPWIAKGILTSIGEKNKLLKKFIKTGDQLTYCRYKTYRDNLNHLIRKSKKKYYTQYFFDAKNAMKKMWRQINEIIHKGENKDNINCVKTSRGIENKPHVIGNKFNNYFTTIAQNLVSKIKTAPDSQQFLDPQVQESIFLSPTTKEEVAKHINSLNSKKASDIYGMSAIFLKTLSSSVSESLSTLYNESFSQGIFPDHMHHMQHVMVTPVHKGDSKLDMTNYRPISVLPICSKILEKLMLTRLLDFFDRNNIIYKQQFGFQKNKSTTQAVFDLYAGIVGALDKENYACSVFLDFAKAFGTADHKILLSKLQNYGMRGIAKNWFESYVTNHKQVVKVGNVLSGQKFITCGVPQGSILGPILFLLYINDIKNSPKILSFFLFADDTSAPLINKKVEEIEKIYNEELKHISEWLNANKHSLNTGKSNLILFRKIQTKITYKPDIKIMGEGIKEKEFTKYLGVLIDKTLSWTYHINHVNLKISRGKAILTKLSLVCL